MIWFAEILRIPTSIILALLNIIFTSISILKQFIEKLNREHINLINRFKLRYIYMQTICDIQKYSIDKENESFNVKMLAPRQTQIKKELRKSFIFNLFIVFIFLIHNAAFVFFFVGLAVVSNVLLIFLFFYSLQLIIFCVWFLFFIFTLIFIFNDFLFCIFFFITLLNLFPLSINFPVFKCTLLRTINIKIKN